MASALESPSSLEKVLSWRTRGVSYSQIASAMGVPEDEARRLGKLAAEQAAKEVEDDETIRTMQLYRLHLVEGRLMQWLDKQEAGERLVIRAVFLLLQVAEARDRLLGREIQTKPAPGHMKGQLTMEDIFMSDTLLQETLSGEDNGE